MSHLIAMVNYLLPLEKLFMSKAIIRLTLRVEVDNYTTDSIASKIHAQTAESLHADMSFYGAAKWENIKQQNPKLAETLNNEATNIALGQLRMVRNKIPTIKDNSIEAGFKFNDCIVDILESTNGKLDSHKIVCRFTTEEFTLLEVIGNKLLLIQGNYANQIAAGNELNGTFLYEIGDGFNISHYTPLN
jgi:hypothetical protein